MSTEKSAFVIFTLAGFQRDAAPTNAFEKIGGPSHPDRVRSELGQGETINERLLQDDKILVYAITTSIGIRCQRLAAASNLKDSLRKIIAGSGPWHVWLANLRRGTSRSRVTGLFADSNRTRPK